MSEAQAQPINVCITGAAGQIAYSLIYMVSRGEVFGKSQPMNLFLLDIAPMLGVLDGVVMEIQDCAFSLVRNVVATADEAVSFLLCDAAFLVGAMPRREGMERKDLLKANAKIFQSQGKSLDQHANKTVKVLVVGNPANTNALICASCAPSIPRKNFTAMTRLDQNRASAQIALRLGVRPQQVHNALIWGNHSSTQFPDAANATVHGMGEGQGGKSVYDCVQNDHWLKEDFVHMVQTRGAAVLGARKLSSAMSAAKAACDHMRDWWQGTPDGQLVSMAVFSEGNPYNIDPALVFSFPVTCANGDWTYVPGLANEFTRSKLDVTEKELVEEREAAMAFIS